MARQPSWAEANVLSERSDSKGSQQLDPLHTLTAIVTRNSPVRGEARGATVGQFADNPGGSTRWADEVEGYRWCERSDARAKLGKPCSRRAVGAVERAARTTTRGPLNREDGQGQTPSPAQRPARSWRARAGQRGEARAPWVCPTGPDTRQPVNRPAAANFSTA